MLDSFEFVIIAVVICAVLYGIGFLLYKAGALKQAAVVLLAVLLLGGVAIASGHAEEHIILTTYATYADIRDNEIVTVVPYKFRGEIREATWGGELQGWRYLHLIIDDNGDVVVMNYLEAGN